MNITVITLIIVSPLLGIVSIQYLRTRNLLKKYNLMLNEVDENNFLLARQSGKEAMRIEQLLKEVAGGNQKLREVEREKDVLIRYIKSNSRLEKNLSRCDLLKNDLDSFQQKIALFQEQLKGKRQQLDKLISYLSKTDMLIVNNKKILKNRYMHLEEIEQRLLVQQNEFQYALQSSRSHQQIDSLQNVEELRNSSHKVN
ncbi:MAG: hypothetical protein KKE17_07435 [Proteobacteria bacterium]|nr:hypothetical protein [Pseudomonadota bacterium]MBU1709819.1 hypothetical protein [Pseudomonadota bacterium]